MRYVTFGQDHRHEINGRVFDKDCVALVIGDRETVFEIFGRVFCFEYTPEEFKRVDMRHFPRGIIRIEDEQ